MGPLPKRRWSTRRQGKKRATHVLEVNLSFCPNCKAPKRPHLACPKCGFYKGVQVIKIKQKKEKPRQ